MVVHDILYGTIKSDPRNQLAILGAQTACMYVI